MTDTDTETARELAERLRAIADWVETRPTIAAEMKYAFSFMNAFFTAEQWPAALREAGNFAKGDLGGYLVAHIDIVPGVGLGLNVSKELTCQRVQVGEQTVEREVYPDDVKPTIETVMEPVYEWVCPDSWLEPEEAT